MATKKPRQDRGEKKLETVRQKSAKKSSGTGSRQADNTSKLTVMVVEDYDDTRLMVRQVLERQGYRVREAMNGMEAVELARREHPDLILMDINLPLIDGVNATRRIGEIEGMSDVPIVALSAYDSPELRESALGAGCVEYLNKPINVDQLGELVHRLLPLKRS
jgi:two-component system, cell cycle response regulator DivK